MRYFIIGYMGCGKSYKGREMAKSLNLPFIDLDHWIEANESTTIVKLFSSKGENYFREKEHEALKTIIATHTDVVVATGGGTPCFFDNMDLMNSAGETIFLNPSIETLYRRLGRNRIYRPLIAQLSDVELKEFIKQHLNQRLPFYSKAKTIIYE